MRTPHLQLELMLIPRDILGLRIIAGDPAIGDGAADDGFSHGKTAWT